MCFLLYSFYFRYFYIVLLFSVVNPRDSYRSSRCTSISLCVGSFCFASVRKMTYCTSPTYCTHLRNIIFFKTEIHPTVIGMSAVL